MARANRYQLPGQVWHITHRCHQREFLLKFAVTGPAPKTYAYDAIGNITNKSDVGDYTYDPAHPHAVSMLDRGRTKVSD